MIMTRHSDKTLIWRVVFSLTAALLQYAMIFIIKKHFVNYEVYDVIFAVWLF